MQILSYRVVFPYRKLKAKISISFNMVSIIYSKAHANINRYKYKLVMIWCGLKCCIFVKAPFDFINSDGDGVE
jgi:hypothetical protein